MRLIDADKLKDIISDTWILDRIDEQPTVEVEPIWHGKWITDEDGNIKCSECGHRGVGDDYCERCGAKMEAKDV